MNVKVINPFIKASIEVLNNFVGAGFSIGKPYLKGAPYGGKDLVIMLGLVGDIKGNAAILMDEDVAKTIASNMMMGMQVETLDDMAKSAIQELGNMVMGNAATLLSNEGIVIDITPPTLLRGSAIEITSSKTETICVPLISSMGDIEFDISIKE